MHAFTSLSWLLTDGTTVSHRQPFAVDQILRSTTVLTDTNFMLSITKGCQSLNVIDTFSLFKRENASMTFVVDDIFRYNLLSMTRLEYNRIYRRREIVVDDNKSSTTSGLVCQQPVSIKAVLDF